MQVFFGDYLHYFCKFAVNGGFIRTYILKKLHCSEKIPNIEQEISNNEGKISAFAQDDRGQKADQSV